jgi:hypothetical protein
VGAPSLSSSPGAARSGSSTSRSSAAAVGGLFQGSSGAAQGRTSTTAAAAGAALGSSSAFRPSQEPPYLVGLPSSQSEALGFGAFIVPTDGASRGLFGFGQDLLGASEGNLLSLLGLPDFLRIARAQAARRAGGELAGVPDVNEVLGQQATLNDLGEGGGLTFGHLPLLALALVLLSSFLLVGAVVPPGMVARTPMSPTSYAKAREPLALAAIGILVPVAVVALVVALS